MLKNKSLICAVWMFLLSIAFFIGCYISIKYLKSYYGLIIGVVAMALTIPFYFKLKNKIFVMKAITILNGVASGLAAGTYYVLRNVNFNLFNNAVVLLLNTGLFVMMFIIKDKHKLIFFFELIIIIVLINLWIFKNKSIFSFTTFIYIINIFVNTAYRKTEINNKILFKHICLSSYWAFCIITFIVILILSEGDGFDDFNFGGTGSKTKKRKIEKEIPLNKIVD